MRTATEILAETGRTDFRVQDLVDRSRSSLRTFYQHFKNRDDMLLVLLEQVFEDSVNDWRARTEGLDATESIRIVLSRMYTTSNSPRHRNINRALSSFYLHLAETHPGEYARVVMPVQSIVAEVIARDVERGVLRQDISAETMALLVTQTALAAARLHALEAELPGVDLNSDAMWRFSVSGMRGDEGRNDPGSPTPSAQPAASVSPLPTKTNVFSPMYLSVLQPVGYDLAVEMPLTPYVVNARNELPAELVAMLVGSAADRVVNADRRGDDVLVSTTMSLTVFGPATVGPVRANATVLDAGMRTTVVRVDVHDTGTASLVAVGTSTFGPLDSIAATENS